MSGHARQTCGLVTGDLFVSRVGEVIADISGREGERSTPAN
jgi:hypothetical protein